VLRKQDIAVGRSYVNESAHVAREVIEEIDRRKVKYNAFDLLDGRLIPAAMQTCRKSELAHWADREAKPDEIARIHPFEALPWFEAIQEREAKSAEIELTRANIQQVVGNNTIHRW
jgi:ABC-type cobalt transport system substrate-binding protein